MIDTQGDRNRSVTNKGWWEFLDCQMPFGHVSLTQWLMEEKNVFICSTCWVVKMISVNLLSEISESPDWIDQLNFWLVRGTDKIKIVYYDHNLIWPDKVLHLNGFRKCTKARENKGQHRQTHSLCTANIKYCCNRLLLATSCCIIQWYNPKPCVWY